MGSWDVLSFSLRLDWSDGIGHTVKFLLPRFARERKVLNFNPPWEWRQAYKHPTKLYRVQDNLWHFEWGRLFPFFRRPRAAVRTTAFLRSLCVRWLCTRLGIGEHIYLVWNPAQAPIVQWLPRRFTVYYAYDQFDKFYHEKREWWEETVRHESSLNALASLSFGVSELIVRSLREKGFQHTFYAPNGVDYDLFAQGGDREPEDLKPLPRPRLCYAGGIAEGIDFRLLHALAKALPTYTFVLIGKRISTMPPEKQDELNKLLRTPNVVYLGWYPHQRVASYVRHMDAGIVCYDMKTSTLYSSSLKTFEYLAAGLPVIAAPIPEIVKLGDIVYTASSLEEWVSQIERALREDSPNLRRRRQEFARQHSWDNRAKQVMKIIEQAYREWKGMQQ